MEKVKKSGFRRFIAWLVIILLLVIAVIFALYFLKPYLPEIKQNITIYENKTEYVTVQPGKANIYDTILWIGTTLIISGLVGFLGYHFFKFLQSRRILTNKNWELCVKSAVKRLKSKYPIDFEEPLTSERFYGGGEEKNLGWGFVFARAGTDYTKPLSTISKFNLISCFVDGKTLDVMGEDHCRDLNDLEDHLRLQRLGKKADPYFPVKPEREPTLFGGGLPEGASVNVPLEESEETE